MKKAGRTSLVLIAVVVAVLIGGVVLLLMLSGEAPETVAGKWLAALAKGDVDTLTDLSYFGNRPESYVRDQWQFATHTANPYYRFRYQVEGSRPINNESAAVHIEMMPDSNKPNPIPLPYDLGMVKVNGRWKVDVRTINRAIYPALPRP